VLRIVCRCGIFLFAALLTLVAFPFSTGALAAANLRNSISNFRSTLLVVAPLVLLRRGYFRVAVAFLMIELFLLAFHTFYSIGLEAGWIGALEIAFPISLAALALGRRWLLVMYAVSIAGVAATAFARNEVELTQRPLSLICRRKCLLKMLFWCRTAGNPLGQL